MIETSFASLLAVTMISTIGGVVPILLGVIAARFWNHYNTRFSVYGPAISAGILLSTFYDLLQETAGLQIGTLKPLTQAVTLLLFLSGLIVTQLFLLRKGKLSKILLASLLAYSWAIGIGLHGFGEGIVIGSGFVSGQAEYGDLIQVLSFGLHKVGEGFTLGTLLSISKLKSRDTLASGLVAGLPVGIGGGIGFLVGSTEILTYAFAVGAGFAGYFMIEFSRMLSIKERVTYLAVAAGFVFMYLAGLLHQF